MDSRYRGNDKKAYHSQLRTSPSPLPVVLDLLNRIRFRGLHKRSLNYSRWSGCPDMCGRFEIHSAIEIIVKIFGIDPAIFDINPNYSVAPSQDVAVVVNDGKKKRLVSCRWGFVPSWSKELKTGLSTINARAETIATSRTFRDAFENRRCLVVADGFFEWKKEGRAKKPFYIRARSGQPLGFAGLYNYWTSPEGEELCTTTIITTDANELILPIHDRMPAITPEDYYDVWLDSSHHDREALLAILKPYPSIIWNVIP